MKNVHLIVFGRVQGVGFRHYTKLKADEMGIKGWVQNKLDGTVEIEAEGKEEAVKLFTEEIKKGPRPFAKVKHVEISSFSDDRKGFNDFKVKL
ncbi:acylphosphatase [Salirhabdus euzebyi]|uniref:Acylphosphatase n=1 Tax=Salirhabdus euzebyi TaxID=394506 RepID=A0A841PU21_9BACI|nr:acylphosphatase [Salirhabdus euzebyi]MBB6452300.1 acylphosphatase [Salirhabdus euzebyi]